MALLLLPLLLSSLLTLSGVASSNSLREHDVPGRAAWELARRWGFEFHPLLPHGPYVLSGARDGAATRLKRCVSSGAPCGTEAEVVSGEMSVLAPECPAPCARVHTFRMFAGRQLAPGWRILRYELAGGRRAWVREPRYGTGDASFELRLEARRGEPARVSVRSLVLAGPAGEDWRRAFVQP